MKMFDLVDSLCRGSVARKLGFYSYGFIRRFKELPPLLQVACQLFFDVDCGHFLYNVYRFYTAVAPRV